MPTVQTCTRACHSGICRSKYTDTTRGRRHEDHIYLLPHPEACRLVPGLTACRECGPGARANMPEAATGCMYCEIGRCLFCCLPILLLGGVCVCDPGNSSTGRYSKKQCGTSLASCALWQRARDDLYLLHIPHLHSPNPQDVSLNTPPAADARNQSQSIRV